MADLLHVDTLSAGYGEAVVLRILDRGDMMLGTEHLGII